MVCRQTCYGIIMGLKQDYKNTLALGVIFPLRLLLSVVRFWILSFLLLLLSPSRKNVLVLQISGHFFCRKSDEAVFKIDRDPQRVQVVVVGGSRCGCWKLAASPLINVQEWLIIGDKTRFMLSEFGGGGGGGGGLRPHCITCRHAHTSTP